MHERVHAFWQKHTHIFVASKSLVIDWVLPCDWILWEKGQIWFLYLVLGTQQYQAKHIPVANTHTHDMNTHFSVLPGLPRQLHDSGHSYKSMFDLLVWFRFQSTGLAPARHLQRYSNEDSGDEGHICLQFLRRGDTHTFHGWTATGRTWQYLCCV